MRAKIASVAGVLVLALVGVGSSTARTKPPLRFGQSAKFAGDAVIGSGAGQEVAVTVQAVTDPAIKGIREFGSAALPPDRGERRVAVLMTFRSLGTKPYNDDPTFEMSLISSSTHGPVGEVDTGITGPGQCATDLSEGVDVPGGTWERGCLYFDVPKDQRIASVQYETQGGDYLARWTVR